MVIELAKNNWDIGLGLRLKQNEIKNIQSKIDSIGQNKPITLKIDNSEALKQINAVKKQIQSLSNIKINLANVSSNAEIKTPKIVDGSDTRYIYTVTEAYKQLVNVLNQLNSKETDLKKLDIKANPEQIKVLKNQIKELNTEADKLINTWANKFTLIQNNNIDRLLGNSSMKSNQLSAQLVDKANIQESVNAYQSLLNLQNQISSKKISIAKLDDSTNKNEITELISQLNTLEQRYAELKNQLSGKLSIGQLQELDNVAKDTANKIEVLNAKMSDLNSVKATNGNVKELQAQFQSLVNTAKQMEGLKIKIQGLENSGGSANQISQLNTQLKDLEATFTSLYNGFYNNAGFLELESSGAKLNSVFADAENKLKELQAVYEDTRASFANKIQTDFVGSGKLSLDIKKLQTDFKKLGIEDNKVTDGIRTLQTLLSQMDSSDNVESVITDYEKFQQVLKTTQNTVKELTINASQASSALALDAKKEKLNRDIELWFKNNSALAKQFGAEMLNIKAQIQSADGTKLNALQAQLDAVKVKAQLAGGSALTFGDRLKTQLSKLSIYFSGIMLITRSVQILKNMVNNVIDLDTSLIDLKKTTTATNEELKEFYFNANDIGKELGTTTKAVVQAAADWSRLGYNIKDAQEMAKTSSIFASISPNVDIEKATDGLVSAMKAYKIEASDALDGVASKINIIGNTQAVSNEDIVEFLTRSSSAMAVANNTLDETIALGTAITEITRDAANAGQVMKTASMRIRGYDEETQELSADVQVLVGDIANLTKTAQHPIGVSIFSDEAKTQYKSTVEILREISKVWDELTDKQQAQVLEALGGKRGGQALAAAIENFSTVEKSLNTMQHSAGNAMQEMSVIEESLDFKLNKLKETGVGVAQNVFSEKSVGGWITGLTKALEVIDKLTQSVGGLGTAFTGLMAYKGLRGQAIFDIFGTGKSSIKDIKNFFTQPILTQSAISAGLTQDSIKPLQQYTALINSGTQATVAFRQTMVGASPATRAYAKEIARGNVQLNELTTSSKAAAIGMNLLNAAMNIGVSLAISAGISLIYKAINTAKEAYQTADEAAKKAKQNVENAKAENQQIQELINKYKELKEAETPDNKQETRQKMLELQEEISNIIAGQSNLYQEQSKNIDLVNGSLKEQLGILQDIESVNMSKVVEEAESSFEAATSKLNQFVYHKGNSVFGAWDSEKNVIEFDAKGLVSENSAQGNKIINQVMEKLGTGKATSESNDFDTWYKISFDEETTWQQRLETLNQIVDALRSSSEYNTSKNAELFTEIKKVRDEVQEIVTEQNQSAQEFLSLYTQSIAKNINFNDVNSYDDYLMRRKGIIDKLSLNKNVANALDTGVINKEDIVNTVDDYLSGMESIADYYEEWIKRNTNNYKNMSDAEKAWISQTKINANSIASVYRSTYNEIKEIEEDRPQLTLFDVSEYTDSLKDVDKAMSSFESAIKSIDDNEMPDAEFFGKFPELAQYADDLTLLRQKIFELMSSYPDEVIQELKTLKENIDLSKESLEEEFKLLSVGGTVNLANRPVINTEELKKAGWSDVEGDVATVYTSGYSNGETGKKAIAINFTPIVVDENGNYIGVLSPDELEEYAQGVIAGTRTDDLHLQIGAKFTGKKAVEESEAAAENIHKLQEYYYVYNDKQRQQESRKQKKQIDGLITMLDKLGHKAKEVNGVLTNLSVDDYIKSEENHVQGIIDKLEAEKDAQNEILDSLKEQKEQLEQIISDYEKTASAVEKYIDKAQIKPLEKQKSDVEEYYNTQIEKLKEENEERNRNIELQEKQDALANARKTRARVFSETQGWHYENNVTAVKQAEKDLAEYQNSMAIENLEKARDAEVKGIEEQIKSWEEYKEAWKEQVEQITETDEELIASKILGADWQEKISEQSIDVMNNYGAEYASYNNQLKNHVNVEISNVEKAIKEREKEINGWKNYKTQLSKTQSDIAQSNKDYLDDLHSFMLDEKSSFEDRIKYMEEYLDNLKKLNQSANDEESFFEQLSNGKMPKSFDESNDDDNSSSWFHSKVKRYASGGVNTQQGISWLDGTDNSPEVVFNSSQAQRLYDIVRNGNFGDMIKNNILSSIKQSYGQTQPTVTNISANNEINLSFPNAVINAKDYDTFKGFMDRYTNDLLLKMQVGL